MQINAGNQHGFHFVFLQEGNQANQSRSGGQCPLSPDSGRVISFTGNGGGSELRFIRGDAYLTLTPLQQVLSPQDVISVDLTRKQIRNGNWKAVNSISSGS